MDNSLIRFIRYVGIGVDDLSIDGLRDHGTTLGTLQMHDVLQYLLYVHVHSGEYGPGYSQHSEHRGTFHVHSTILSSSCVYTRRLMFVEDISQRKNLFRFLLERYVRRTRDQCTPNVVSGTRFGRNANSAHLS